MGQHKVEEKKAVRRRPNRVFKHLLESGQGIEHTGPGSLRMMLDGIDFLPSVVDLGVSVHCVMIERGWKEIDTVEDYQKALKAFEA